MKKYDKQPNTIQRLMDDNFKSMSEKTKENLFGASNAVFGDKELFFNDKNNFLKNY